MHIVISIFAALFALAPSAFAVEVYKSRSISVDIYGEMSALSFFGEQDDDIAPRASDNDNYPFLDEDGDITTYSVGQIRTDGRVGIDASGVVMNGYRVGMTADLELSGDIEVAFIYMSGPFGQLQIGQPSTVSGELHLTEPGFLPTAGVDYADFIFYRRLSAADSTYFVYDDVALKLNYISPAIQGFQFAIGWTPDPSEGFDISDSVPQGIQSQRGDGDDGYIVEDVVTIMAQFSREESFGLNWGVSGGYIFGNPSAPAEGPNSPAHVNADPPETEIRSEVDPQGYSVGLQLSWLGVEFGGAWTSTEGFASQLTEDRVWVVGIAYAQDDWRVGATYRQSIRREDDTCVIRNDAANMTNQLTTGIGKCATKSNKEIEVGLSYSLGSGLFGSMMFEYVIDKNPRITETRTRTSDSYGGGFMLTYEF